MAAFLSGFQAGSSAYGRGLDIRARREEGALNRALDERKLMGAESDLRLRGRILEQDLARKSSELQEAATKSANEATANRIQGDYFKAWQGLPKEAQTPDNFNQLFGSMTQELLPLGQAYAQKGLNLAQDIGKGYAALNDAPSKTAVDSRLVGDVLMRRRAIERAITTTLNDPDFIALPIEERGKISKKLRREREYVNEELKVLTGETVEKPSEVQTISPTTGTATPQGSLKSLGNGKFSFIPAR
jgi:hypothetical protein